MRPIGPQQPQFRAAEPDRQIERISAPDHEEQAGDVGEHPRERRPGQSQFGHRAKSQNENRIEHQRQHQIEHGVPQRRHRVSHPAHRRLQQDIEEDEGHADEHHLEEGLGIFERRGRRRQQPQDRRHQQAAEHGDQQADADESASSGTNRAPHFLDVAPANCLPDHDRCRHREAEHARKDQKHHHVGDAGCGKGILAKKLADIDRADRAVERLQHIRSQRRQGEQQQGLGDRPLGQIAADFRPGNEVSVINEGSFAHVALVSP